MSPIVSFLTVKYSIASAPHRAKKAGPLRGLIFIPRISVEGRGGWAWRMAATPPLEAH